MIKTIGYAYATSDTAKALGALATGCYYVETKAEEASLQPFTIEGPFTTLQDAEQCAMAIDAEWSRYTRRAA